MNFAKIFTNVSGYSFHQKTYVKSLNGWSQGNLKRFATSGSSVSRMNMKEVWNPTTSEREIASHKLADSTQIAVCHENLSCRKPQYH